MLTIFTPTYNRGYILTRLYNSLLKQSNKNFEWIIVDDGSTDNTQELINIWKKENKIDIKNIYQENQGKMIAHNVGVENARGDLFVCVDSDDYLKENAVDIILSKVKKIDKDDNCTGMVGKKVFNNGQPVGTDMPNNVKYSTLRELYSKYKYRGDTVLVFKTNIIKKYYFPKIEGEKFIPETYLYDNIDNDGKLMIMDEEIYVCEYLEDGYTANSAAIIKNNPKGYIMYAKQRMNNPKVSFKLRFKASAQFILGNWLARNKGYIKKSKRKLMLLLAIPFAAIIYLTKYRK